MRERKKKEKLEKEQNKLKKEKKKINEGKKGWVKTGMKQNQKEEWIKKKGDKDSK